MKVLHLIGGGDVGGAKIHVLSLVKELSKNIEVKIISLREGSFSEEARKMGIDIEVVRTRNIFKDIKKIAKIIKDGNYNFVHSHGAKANMLSVVCKRITGVTTITTVHSDYKLDYLQSVTKRITFGFINSIALRCIDFYIAVSSNFKDMLIERGFPAQKIYTVYNGIDFSASVEIGTRDEFCRKFNIEIGREDLVVGILARLHPVKDIPTFLRAAKEVLIKNKNVKFIIGGDGENKGQLEDYAKELGILDNIYFIGFINNPYEFMNIMDINVLTSISESFPYSILEGTKLKKATISSDVGGIFDLIDNGINGYLFEAGDYKELSEDILKLLNDKRLRETMGDRLNEKAQREFSLFNMRETQLSIYYDIKENLEKCPNILSNDYDITISGYYGYGNIGDEAMLEAIIKTFRKSDKNIKLAVFSSDPKSTSKLHKVRAVNRFNILKVFTVLMRTKLYINGGGSLIQDNTSDRSLWYYLGVIALAKVMRTRVMIYANGIGPLNKSTNRKIARFILNKVDVITVRDEQSLQELKSLGVKKPEIELTADAALTIEAVQSEVVDKILISENIKLDKPLIGFSIRKWGKDKKYLEIIAKIADYTYEKYNMMPIFIPMDSGDDLKVSEEIISKMKNKVYVIRGKYSPEEMLGIMSKVEILVGMRLHALIFAASLGIPCMGVVYEPKVEGFVNYVRQASAGRVEDLKYEELENLLDEVYQERKILGQYLLSVTPELKEKAVRNSEIALELLNITKKGR